MNPNAFQKSPVEEEPAIAMAKMTTQGQRYIGGWFDRHFEVNCTREPRISSILDWFERSV